MLQIRRKQFAFGFSVFAYVCFALSLIYLIAFVLDYRALPVTVDRGPATAAWMAAAVDGLLISLFGLQHSVMARRWFKTWWTRLVPAPIERSTYVLVSCAATIALCSAWRPIPEVVWSAESLFSFGLWGTAFVAGVGILLVASFQLDHWELLGLRQTWDVLRGIDGKAVEFSKRGLYRLVRHPIYVGWLLLFWVTPRMTIGHLTLAGGMTIYTLIAIRLEERDLVRQHGRQYVEYRKRVAALVPWRLTRIGRKAHDAVTGLLPAFIIALSGLGLAMSTGDVFAGGSLEHITLRSGGRDRSAVLFSSDETEPPRRIVVMLHGAGGDAERIRRFTAYGLERFAAEGRWIIAYPEGIGGTWNDCRRSPPYRAKALGVDDVTFLTDLMELLQSRYGVASEDVLVAGFSNGGQMAIRLAIEQPQRLGMLAVIAAQLPVQSESVCRSRMPAVRSLWINGSEDPFLPIEGGRSFGPDGVDLGHVASLAATVQAFGAAFPSASPSPAEWLAEKDGNASTYVIRTDWYSAGEIVLRQLLLHGSGHVVPQREVALPSIAGPAAGDISLGEVIAELFSE